MKTLLTIAGIALLAACDSPTAPATTDLDLAPRLGCVQLHGSDRWQCDSYGEANTKAQETNSEEPIQYVGGYYYVMPGLCVEDCT